MVAAVYRVLIEKEEERKHTRQSRKSKVLLSLDKFQDPHEANVDEVEAGLICPILLLKRCPRSAYRNETTSTAPYNRNVVMTRP